MIGKKNYKRYTKQVRTKCAVCRHYQSKAAEMLLFWGHVSKKYLHGRYNRVLLSFVMQHFYGTLTLIVEKTNYYYFPANKEEIKVKEVNQLDQCCSQNVAELGLGAWLLSLTARFMDATHNATLPPTSLSTHTFPFGRLIW